jgi:hypothetical protein
MGYALQDLPMALLHCPPILANHSCLGNGAIWMFLSTVQSRGSLMLESDESLAAVTMRDEFNLSDHLKPKRQDVVSISRVSYTFWQ